MVDQESFLTTLRETRTLFIDWAMSGHCALVPSAFGSIDWHCTWNESVFFVTDDCEKMNDVDGCVSVIDAAVGMNSKDD